MVQPELIVEKQFVQKAENRRNTRFAIYIKALVPDQLEALLLENCADEVIMQKPVLYGSLPFSIHRDAKGIPTNAHLLNFLKSGETIVVDVTKLLNGYTFRSDNIWDAIAFEDFARSSFDRFCLLCEHADGYR
ncbi:MAG: hypothetical protein AAFN43_06465 [Pseudomonadota bacterium]